LVQISGKCRITKEKIMKTAVTLLIIVSFLIMPLSLFAQQAPSVGPGQAGRQPPGAVYQKMKEQQEAMKAEQDRMMKEMDVRLDAKVAAMDAAKGEKKIDAIEAVIKEMVAQRKEMREHMMKAREEMGRHWQEQKAGRGEGGDAHKEGM
jgi:Spy/CpxP family protein refolding chaperone